MRHASRHARPRSRKVIVFTLTSVAIAGWLSAACAFAISRVRDMDARAASLNALDGVKCDRLLGRVSLSPWLLGSGETVFVRLDVLRVIVCECDKEEAVTNIIREATLQSDNHLRTAIYFHDSAGLRDKHIAQLRQATNVIALGIDGPHVTPNVADEVNAIEALKYLSVKGAIRSQVIDRLKTTFTIAQTDDAWIAANVPARRAHRGGY